MSFQVVGLSPQPFAPLFGLGEQALRRMGAARIVADSPDAYPCRIRLERVEAGEELLLVHHVHQPVETSPYRSGGPIFVSRSGSEPAIYRDELPPMLRDRLLALRAYDERAFIVDAEVGEGADVLALIERFLADPAVVTIHAHFARRGCYAARVERT